MVSWPVSRNHPSTQLKTRLSHETIISHSWHPIHLESHRTENPVCWHSTVSFSGGVSSLSLQQSIEPLVLNSRHPLVTTQLQRKQVDAGFTYRKPQLLLEFLKGHTKFKESVYWRKAKILESGNSLLVWMQFPDFRSFPPYAMLPHNTLAFHLYRVS